MIKSKFTPKEYEYYHRSLRNAWRDAIIAVTYIIESSKKPRIERDGIISIFINNAFYDSFIVNISILFRKHHDSITFPSIKDILLSNAIINKQENLKIENFISDSNLKLERLLVYATMRKHHLDKRELEFDEIGNFYEWLEVLEKAKDVLELMDKAAFRKSLLPNERSLDTYLQYDTPAIKKYFEL